MGDSGEEQEEKSESVVTVIVAALMNLAIAIAKLIAGLLSGSAAMMSEAAHSAADTVTQIMLYAALRNSARPPDEVHPFGYGRTAYLWAVLAAACTFVAGGLFSITHGLHSINSEAETDFLVSYIVLAIAFILEGVSFLRTISQVRSESRQWSIGPGTLLRRTPDTTLKAVFLEDAAALTGLLLAALGLALTEITGNTFYDGGASVLIGVLLLAVAVSLGRANVSLLVGRAVSPRLRAELREELEASEDITAVGELLTLYLGPSDVLVAARVDFRDGASGAAIERTGRDAEARLRERYASVKYVFLSPYGPPDDHPAHEAPYED
ncbi:cation diffusion facilitator family transporter [Glycomyces arizonensis]|uniref:cation diffusion facilitator family transporter n=1 Tax=Glycomyces arizonensis TaxID=256035 RepID=UPI0003F75E25|nr:cation diffusion facilitator family transporter [Glycomyces arizonensis]